MTRHHHSAAQSRVRFLWLIMLLLVVLAVVVGTILGARAAHRSPMQAGYPMAATQTGRYLSAHVARDAGQLKDALGFTLDALKQDPKNLRLLEQAYRSAIFAGDYDALANFASQLPADAQVGLAPRFVQGLWAMRQKQYPAALGYFDQMPSKGFALAFQNLFRAWAQVGAGTLKAPLAVPNFAENGGELAIMMNFHTALINDVAGFSAAAAQNYAVLVQNADKLPARAYEATADFFMRHHKAEQAQALYATFLKTHPDVPTSAPDAGRPRFVSNPQQGTAELLNSMGGIFIGMQASGEAVAYLRLALMLREDLASARYLLGMLLEQAKQFEAARKQYVLVPPTEPLYVKAQLRAAMTHYRKGDSKAAFATLDRLSKRGARVDVLLATGDLKRENKDWRAAATAYTQALTQIEQARPEHWHIYYARGIAYERANQWPKAEADFLKALALKPKEPEVMNYLGYSWLIQRQHVPQAKAMITEALLLQPENPAIMDSMGWAHFLEGNYKDALALTEQAAQSLPKDPTINDHLGDIYWRLGRQAEAQYQWERALLFNPTESGERQALEKKLRDGLSSAGSADSASRK